MVDAYDDSLTLREARALYFAANHFGDDGGYDAVWVDVKIGPIKTQIRNTKGRVRAVRFHDLHHVLTGYRTTFRGESEIAAWEVASGCADHWAAWGLNLSAFGAGLFFATIDVWRAFQRGRQSRNLYCAVFDDGLLARRVGDVQRELGLTVPMVCATATGWALFVMWALIALPLLLVQVVTSPITIPVIAVLSRVGRRRASVG